MKNGVTIGIPVFNEEARIEHAVRSAVDQCDTLIISDNASTDSTPEICRRLAHEFKHIRYTRHEKNLGAYRNWAHILDGVETEYVLFLGSHDSIGPGSVERLLEAMNSDPSVQGAFCQLFYDHDGRIVEDRLFNRWSGGTEETPKKRIKSLLYTRLPLGWAMYGLFRTKTTKRLFHHCNLPQGGDIVFLGHTLAEGKLKLIAGATYYAWVRDARRDKSHVQERVLGSKSADKKKLRNLSKIAKHEMLLSCYSQVSPLRRVYLRFVSALFIGTFKYPGFDMSYYLFWLPAKLGRIVVRLIFSLRRTLTEREAG